MRMLVYHFLMLNIEKKLGKVKAMVGAVLIHIGRWLTIYLKTEARPKYIYHWQCVVVFSFIFMPWACESDILNHNCDKPYDLQNIWYKWTLIPAHPSWWNNVSWRCKFVYIFINLAPEQHIRYIPSLINIDAHTFVSDKEDPNMLFSLWHFALIWMSLKGIFQDMLEICFSRLYFLDGKKGSWRDWVI